MSLSHCPKCQHERRPEHAACVRCGLTVARWATFRSELPSHEVLDPAWAHLLTLWDEPAQHARFVDLAVTCGGLAIAAARYRSVCNQPSHRDAAVKALGRVSLLAERLCAQAEVAARPRAPGRAFRLVLVALGIAFVTVTGAFFSDVRGTQAAVAIAGASLR